MFNSSPLSQKAQYSIAQSKITQDVSSKCQQPTAFPNQSQLTLSQQQTQTLQVQSTASQQGIVAQQSFQSIRSVRVNQVSIRSTDHQVESQACVGNIIAPLPQESQQQSTQIRMEGSKSLRNYVTSSPQAPQSYKSNNSFPLSKPSFVEYYPPVYVPHLEPRYAQTIITNPIQVVDVIKFEEIWSKRMEVLEQLLEQRSQVIVENQNYELRASNSDDRQTITDLQTELFSVKTQLEDREAVITLLKQQLQNATEQAEFANKQHRSTSNILTQEMQIKITTLQQTIDKLQLNLISVQQMVETYKQENLLLQCELKRQQATVNEKEEIIIKLQQQLKLTLDQYNLDAQSNKNVSQQKISEFQIKLTSLEQTIASLQSNLNSKDNQLEKLRIQINQLQIEKQQIHELCNQKDETISNLQTELNELYQQVDQMSEEITTTQSIKTFEEEAKMWKQKFKELNDTYHACQEKLMVRDAEYESLVKQQSQQKIVTLSTVIKQNSSRSVLHNSDYRSSSMIQNEVDKTQTIQKSLRM
ncbi:unnamed protein product (macronuclear) [Paramecium tetraurelia]|uniref:Uncharacterized protein n=1 Tax=Paramecium tetraurelia TaxID=5888 RepID=A0DR10_PARTE|nr:uncharacterized protein GSPATT00002878001 [Paramecium tetraurelia]CAK85477.1 unnamed protein product [Paramecium tetraurelia]|eukprot:XP_001452874.1 hypothetical protein (macronuclear) [Paramecium tetraurelia strain d4-2]